MYLRDDQSARGEIVMQLLLYATVLVGIYCCKLRHLLPVRFPFLTTDLISPEFLFWFDSEGVPASACKCIPGSFAGIFLCTSARIKTATFHRAT